jgi:hypothetical protein
MRKVWNKRDLRQCILLMSTQTPIHPRTLSPPSQTLKQSKQGELQPGSFCNRLQLHSWFMPSPGGRRNRTRDVASKDMRKSWGTKQLLYKKHVEDRSMNREPNAGLPTPQPRKLLARWGCYNSYMPATNSQ